MTGQLEMGEKQIPGGGDNLNKGSGVGKCFSSWSVEFVLMFTSMCVYVVCVCMRMCVGVSQDLVFPFSQD